MSSVQIVLFWSKTVAGRFEGKILKKSLDTRQLKHWWCFISFISELVSGISQKTNQHKVLFSHATCPWKHLILKSLLETVVVNRTGLFSKLRTTPSHIIWIIFGNLSKEGRGGGQWSWGHFQTNLIQSKFLVF